MGRWMGRWGWGGGWDGKVGMERLGWEVGMERWGWEVGIHCSPLPFPTPLLSFHFSLLSAPFPTPPLPIPTVHTCLCTLLLAYGLLPIPASLHPTSPQKVASQEMGINGGGGGARVANEQKGKDVALTLSSLADGFAESHFSSQSHNRAPHRLLHQLLNKEKLNN